MVVSYLREGNANEPLAIELPVDKHTESNGLVSATAFVTESHSNPPDIVMHCPKSTQPPKTFVDEVVECFSLHKNFQILTKTSKPPNAVPIIDGLK